MLGVVTQNQNTVAVPLVYAFLSSKESIQYAAVLRAILKSCKEYKISHCRPEKIMTDFEKAIINACEQIFPGVQITCCFFHLGQSVYRHVQASGLQVAYNNPKDRTIKIYVHMMLSLAFVPVKDVRRVFSQLKDDAPEELEDVLDYFEKTYISVRRKTGRVAIRMAPRYAPAVWNQYLAASNNDHKTNNISEGWHNRFHVLMGKNHPDLFSALKEFQKEQADTEISVAELGLGRKVRAAPKKKWVECQNKIRSIVLEYDMYIGRELEYLRAIAHNIVL